MQGAGRRAQGAGRRLTISRGLEDGLLKPLEAGKVEVVGRLVEQQQLRRRRERRERRQPRALPVGERADSLLQKRRVGQRRTRKRAQRSRLARLERLSTCRLRPRRLRLRPAERVRELAHRQRAALERGLRPLRHVSDAQAVGALDLAFVRRELTREQPELGALAAAALAEHAHHLPLAHRPVRVGEHVASTVAHRHVAQLDEHRRLLLLDAAELDKVGPLFQQPVALAIHLLGCEANRCVVGVVLVDPLLQLLLGRSEALPRLPLAGQDGCVATRGDEGWRGAVRQREKEKAEQRWHQDSHFGGAALRAALRRLAREEYPSRNPATRDI